MTFILLAPVTATAADGYGRPTLENLVMMLVRFGAININNDDELADEYAMVEECAIFEKYSQDDFTWHRIRPALRQSVEQNVATFPTTIYYQLQLQLARYDFNAKSYKFTEATDITGANTFDLNSPKPDCNMANVRSLPLSYRILLDHPVDLHGIPMAEDDAKSLLEYMRSHGNGERDVFARVNMRITSIDPLSRPDNDGNNKQQWRGLVQKGSSGGTVRLNAALDSIEFFADHDMTFPIYVYRP